MPTKYAIDNIGFRSHFCTSGESTFNSLRFEPLITSIENGFGVSF